MMSRLAQSLTWAMGISIAKSMAKELCQAHAQEWAEAKSECRQLQMFLRSKLKAAAVQEAKSRVAATFISTPKQLSA